jgi:hypothetical protein
VQVLTEGQPPYVAVVNLVAGQAATLDTGLILPHQPAPGRHAALAGATGASLLTGAVLGALAWRAHEVFAEAYDGCDGREPACTASASTIQQTWVQKQRLTVAAGAAGVATLGLGAALAFTW